MTTVTRPWEERFAELLADGFRNEADLRWFTGPQGLLQICRESTTLECAALLTSPALDLLLTDLDDITVAFPGPLPSQRARAIVGIAAGVGDEQAFAEAFCPAGGLMDPLLRRTAQGMIADVQQYVTGTALAARVQQSVQIAASHHAHGEIVTLQVRDIGRAGVGPDVLEAPFQRFDAAFVRAVATAAGVVASGLGVRYAVTARRSGLPLDAIGGASAGLGAAVAIGRVADPRRAAVDPKWVFTGAIGPAGEVLSLASDDRQGEYPAKLAAIGGGTLVYPVADQALVERQAAAVSTDAELQPGGTVEAVEQLIARHLAATGAYRQALDRAWSRRRRALVAVLGVLLVAGAAVAALAFRGDDAATARRAAAGLAPKQISLAGEGTFFVDQHEVTNEQYAVCMRHGACAGPIDQERSIQEPANAQYPVTGVMPSEAEKFCLFARGGGWGLPTFEQYVAMAAGDEAGEYPHGDLEHVTLSEAQRELPIQITSVDSVSLSFGNLGGVIGNAAEWTRTACSEECRDLPSIVASTTKSVRIFGLGYEALANGDSIDGSWLTKDNQPDLVFNSDRGLYFVGFRCATSTT